MTSKRAYKGRSLIDFPDEYVVLDIETTGLCPGWDEIIEIAALNVVHNEVTDVFHSLINPQIELDPFIIRLTGIDDEILKKQPLIDDVLPDLLNFVNNKTVIGHNVHFDINFIYDNCMACLDIPFKNDLIDTMRLSRLFFPELEHHRLLDMMSYFNIQYDRAHRALDDCRATYEVYNKIRSYAKENGEIPECAKIKPAKTTLFRHKDIKAKDICPQTFEYDILNPIYKKYCVFTGALEKFSRQEAMQIVANIGGYCQDIVTKNTNILILGNNDYCRAIKDGKSSKQKKAEKYILDGQDLIILPESVFYEIISKE